MMRPSFLRATLGVVVTSLAACTSSGGNIFDGGNPGTGRIPLTDIAPHDYLGFGGGLYPAAANVPPADHAAEGARRAALIRPLDREGDPDPRGRIVLLSLGMSNTSQEFCGTRRGECRSWSFVGQVEVDPAVDLSTLAIVDGAFGGQDAGDWESPGSPNYDRVLEERLAPRGLTEAQVQVVWVKQANANPMISLPDPGADAYHLERSLGRIVRNLAQRYPNLQQVYISSRTYGGYAVTPLNPEPYAYESGFAVKWVVEAQIQQARTDRIDVESGDLAYARTPWIAWGPYLWAAGTTPRSDGLVWLREDYGSDGTHPVRSGQEKVADLLLEFFKSAPTSRCWFVEGETCG